MFPMFRKLESSTAAKRQGVISEREKVAGGV